MLKKYTGLFFGIILLDRLTKWWAVTNLSDRVVQVIPGLSLRLTWNRGVSWGLFNRASAWGFSFLTLFIALVIISFAIYTVSEYRHGTVIVFELCVLAGALSNFFDRMYYGAVVDFIDLYVPAQVHGWHWPTFNVADACIVIGIGGVIAKGVLCARRKK